MSNIRRTYSSIAVFYCLAIWFSLRLPRSWIPGDESFQDFLQSRGSHSLFRVLGTYIGADWFRWSPIKKAQGWLADSQQPYDARLFDRFSFYSPAKENGRYLAVANNFPNRYSLRSYLWHPGDPWRLPSRCMSASSTIAQPFRFLRNNKTNKKNNKK